MTGFVLYDPKAGIEDIVVRLTGFYDVDGNWQILARFQAGFLQSSPKNSPLIRQGGDDFQAIGGIGVLYTF